MSKQNEGLDSLAESKINNFTLPPEITSINKANAYIQKNIDSLSADFLNSLLQALSHQSIRGSENDYHNLATTLARNDLHTVAVEVCKAGLAFYGTNIDLLADAIQYTSECGEFSAAESMQMTLTEKVDKRFWNWRCFTFLINFYNMLPYSDSNKETALDLVKTYKETLPYEEKAYMAECETYERYADHSRAVQAMIDGVDKCKMAPQCAGHLAEHYLEIGEFQKAIQAASRALIGNAIPQPSINTGAVFAFRGLAYDGIIHEKLLQGCQIEDMKSEMENAIHDLKCAMRFGFGQPNIATRASILETYLGTQSIDNSLDEKNPDLLSFLKNLSNNPGKDVTDDNVSD